MFLFQLRDEDLPKDVQESNWFSAPSALRVYGQYLNLDKDHNGMLSKEELGRLVLAVGGDLLIKFFSFPVFFVFSGVMCSILRIVYF